MTLRRAVCLVCLLLFGALPPGLNAEEKPKQEAKDLTEKIGRASCRERV